MDNQNTDNKIQQNEAQQPETLQPSLQLSREQNRLNRSSLPATP